MTLNQSREDCQERSVAAVEFETLPDGTGNMRHDTTRHAARTSSLRPHPSKIPAICHMFRSEIPDIYRWPSAAALFSTNRACLNLCTTDYPCLECQSSSTASNLILNMLQRLTFRPRSKTRSCPCSQAEACGEWSSNTEVGSPPRVFYFDCFPATSHASRAFHG